MEAAVQSHLVASDSKGLKFGVIAQSVMCWNWCVDVAGDLAWTHLSNKVPMEDKRLKALLDSESADVVLFDWPGPKTNHLVWNKASATFLVWSIGSYNCHPPRESDWIHKRHWIAQQDLGGATNQMNPIDIAMHMSKVRRERFILLQPVLVGPGCLERVVDRTVQGRVCLEPRINERVHLEEPLLLVAWDNLLALPSTFSKTKFIQRKLMMTEWLKCLDCLAVVLSKWSPEDKEMMAEASTLHFKSQFHVIWSIITYLDSSMESQQGSREYGGGIGKRPILNESPNDPKGCGK